MKALTFPALHEVALTELNRPVPGAGEVLIEVAVSGLCHTDLAILKGDYPATFPIVPGHEFSGTVVEVGSKTSKHLLGVRVSIDPLLPCGQCSACYRGQRNKCSNLGAYGATLNGGFAEFARVSATAVYPIGNLSFEAAALAEPLGCVLHGLSRVKIEQNARIILFGVGPIGLLMLEALRAHGAGEIVCIDLHPSRRKKARLLGAKEALSPDELERFGNLQSFDLAIDATGVLEVAAKLPNYVRDGGQVLFFGVCPPTATIALSPFEVYYRELTLIGSFSLNGEIREALDLLQSGHIRYKEIISHSVNLDGLPELLNQSGSDETLKIQARPN